MPSRIESYVASDLAHASKRGKTIYQVVISDDLEPEVFDLYLSENSFLSLHEAEARKKHLDTSV